MRKKCNENTITYAVLTSKFCHLSPYRRLQGSERITEKVAVR